jgi:hypothetical protein
MHLLFRFLFLGLVSSVLSQEIDETALFGDANAMLVDSATVTSPLADSSTTKPTGIKASGALTGSAQSNFSRDFIRNPGREDTGYPGLLFRTTGELFLDARASDDTKAFAAIEGRYLSDSSQANAYLRELFLDFNVRQRLYVRVGKQVLQWGRCYFWNPSDLVNVEKKSFVERIGTLEGTSGIRLHAPFGTRANLYGFLDAENVKTADQLKATAKAEILLGGTETALSLWKRKDLDPVVAWDISTALHKWNIAGEAAFFPQGFLNHYTVSADTLVSTPNKAFTPRVALSIGRAFDFLDVSDRITVQYEMYYNGLGYDPSPLEDSREYPWKNSVSLDSARLAGLPIPYSIPNLRLDHGPKALWLYANGQIQPYSLGRYYIAFFSSFSKFIIPDLTMSCNGLANLTDGSYMLSGSLTYTTLQNLSLQISGVSLGGTYYGEMTYSGTRFQAQGVATYTF